MFYAVISADMTQIKDLQKGNHFQFKSKYQWNVVVKI